MNIYDFTLKDRLGKDVSLKEFKGKVLLIVNTATACGFTPQYDALESMYEEFHNKGFEIIDIPCNQFGEQAKGSDDEIHEFCQIHFNTKFIQIKKSDVNGENELPLYTFLKKEQGFKGFPEGELKAVLEKISLSRDANYQTSSDIKWNFTKFLVNRKGEVIDRFEPTYDMNLLKERVQKEL